MIKISVVEWIDKIGPECMIQGCLRYINSEDKEKRICNIIRVQSMPCNGDDVYIINSEDNKDKFIQYMKSICNRIIKLKVFL